MKLCLPLGIHRSPRLLFWRAHASAADSHVCLFAGVSLFLSSMYSGSPQDSLHGSSEVMLWKSQLLDTLTQYSDHHNPQLLKGKKKLIPLNPLPFALPSSLSRYYVFPPSSFPKYVQYCFEMFSNLNSNYWLRLGLSHWEEMIGKWSSLSFWAQEAGILTDIILKPRKIYIAIENAIDCSKNSLLSKASIFP